MADGKNKKDDMSVLWKDFPQFKGATVRIDQHTKKASVLDVIALVLGNRDAARMAWKSLKDSTDPSVSGTVRAASGLKINGKGLETDVAPFKALLEIIYLLPGKRAHEFRKTCATYMARLLSGDLTLISEIEARYDNSTAEERAFFRNGVEETPEGKRRREELEEERRLRLKREEAEIERMQLENGRMRAENISMYKSMLQEFGLDRDPRMRVLLNDAVCNMLVPVGGPGRNVQAIEAGSGVSNYMTVNKFVVDRGIECKSTSALGRALSKAWREEKGGEPETTQQMVNGDIRAVKVYPVGFLEKHVK